MGQRRSGPHSVNQQETTMNRCKLIRMTMALAATALLAQLQLPAQTWQTVDDFQYTSGKTAFASGMGADALGNIYSVGSGRDAANISHALVMRSSDRGATWQTIGLIGAAGR